MKRGAIPLVVLATAIGLSGMGRAQDETEPSADLPVAEAIPDHVLLLDETVILCRVTSDLQCRQLGRTPEEERKVRFCMMVDVRRFQQLGDDLDHQADFDAAFKKLNAEKGDAVQLRLIDDSTNDRPMAQVRREQASSEQAIRQSLKEIGYQFLFASNTFKSRFDFRKDIEQARAATEDSDGAAEKSVGDADCRITRVTSLLSQLLFDADLIVEWQPIVRDAEGARFVADVLPHVAELVNDAKPPGGQTMQIRIRYSQSQEEAIEEWINNNPGRKFYAGGLGYELCNVSMTGIAREEEVAGD